MYLRRMDTIPPSGSQFPRPFLKRAQAVAAFSLVEVTLAIGIIAVGFVALIGLLPVGLSTYRSSIDTANESWIIQSLSSMVQVTEWKQVESNLAFKDGGNIYYFDEEGRLTDTEKKPSSDPEVIRNRLYAAKLIVEPLQQPGLAGVADASAKNQFSGARRIIAVITKVGNPLAMKQFEKIIDDETLESEKPRNPDVHVRSFIAAQMDTQ
jgi:uncharacterized protein (TIGR02598 family)